MLATLALTLVLASTGDDCAPIDAACLARVDMEHVVDFSGQGIVTDPVALEIIGRGLDAAPELVALFADPAPTEQRVPLVGGIYAIGDIAMNVTDAIVEVPWWSFLPAAWAQHFEETGESAFYDHVRESPQNRRIVARQAGAWLAEHREALRWDESQRRWRLPPPPEDDR